MTQERTTLAELALLFLRLGTTAFGGPAAHIAMMRDEVVTRRKWLTDQHFLDLISAANLIPGPNSTELAIHIGFARRGVPGLVVAGLAFIVPAMLITLLFGMAYVRFSSLPTVEFALYGVKPVILAVVAQAIFSLLPKAARSTQLKLLLALASLLTLLGVHELLVLFGAGALSLLLTGAFNRKERGEPSDVQRPLILLLPAAAGGLSQALSLSSLFWVFFKIGSVLFGSGYVLAGFLRTELVQRLGWITEAQLIDAIAVGQVTPGPVFTTATFLGYLLLGTPGALIATLGIFLPAFVFVAFSAPFLPRLRASRGAAAFLDGVNVASLALMVVVTLQLANAALIDLPTLLLFGLGAVLLIRFKLNTTWLVLGGAALGLGLHALGLTS